ncbi:Maf family protein [Diplocloster agilis]|uniref:Maf family protein n=1 Tax=Diplocloster agilis TaxID=2850323 RepID=UPI00082048DC|nr:Maf family protein [Suonthocola fibrivorans]MCU6735427.1 Maf family protein [Suonthocola fibrivorans]SCJ73619.1 Septum formation protein Maf [uncultured Clostridium sp.]
MKTRIVLASASPRRRELLSQIGLAYEVLPSQKEEASKAREPSELVTELSAQKAGDIASSIEGPALIIGADTVVCHNGQILGKPRSEEEAAGMLAFLQGDTHQVYTGVTLILKSGAKNREVHFTEMTEVEFGPMDESEIREYIATGEPMDKAGAYGIQGFAARYIVAVRGDYSNVVGLPVARLYRELKKLDVL